MTLKSTMPLVTPGAYAELESAAESSATLTVPDADDGRRWSVCMRIAKPGIAELVMSDRRGPAGLAEARRRRPVDLGHDQGRGNDVVGTSVKRMAEQLRDGRQQGLPVLRRRRRAPALIGPGSAGMPVSVKSPDWSVTAVAAPIETGMPARGSPFSSTTWPETSVDAMIGAVTVTGMTTVPDAVPLETTTEKSDTPTWSGAGENTSSPVPRLKVIFAGSGWGVIVNVTLVPVIPRLGRLTSSVLPTATVSGSCETTGGLETGAIGCGG